ncbi:MAG: LamG domain-containing protein, partial [Actinomycetota bacterium]|nr:LamG domain-containing protein [Actinomycetota bacterium]
MKDVQSRNDGVHHDGAKAARDSASQNRFTRYDGIDDFSAIPASHDLSPKTQLSIEFWMRNRQPGTRAFPLSKAGGQTSRDSEWWFEWRSDDRIAFRLWTAPGTFAQALSASSYDDKSWHHVVATYDGHWVNLFIDGALVGSEHHIGKIRRTPQPIVLGDISSSRTGGPTQFQGDIDELAVYDRALSPTQVDEHYRSGATAVAEFTADTVFWRLMPGTWRALARWQLSFPKGTHVQRVYVDGQPLAKTSHNFQMTYLGGHLSKLEGTYSIPNSDIQQESVITVIGRGASAAPTFTLFMARRHLYETSNAALGGGRLAAAGASGRPLFRSSPQPIDGQSVVWWKAHLWVVISLSILLYSTLAFIAWWSVEQIRRLSLQRRQWLVLAGVASLEILLSILMTNLDVQIFKGLGERYWLYGPLPGLTLTGYGPIIDGLFVIPMLPYILLGHLLGASSEFALNFALRVPIIVGSLFMIGATARLITCMQLDASRRRFVFYGLVLNPVAILW